MYIRIKWGFALSIEHCLNYSVTCVFCYGKHNWTHDITFTSIRHHYQINMFYYVITSNDFYIYSTVQEIVINTTTPKEAACRSLQWQDGFHRIVINWIAHP